MINFDVFGCPYGLLTDAEEAAIEDIINPHGEERRTDEQTEHVTVENAEKISESKEEERTKVEIKRFSDGTHFGKIYFVLSQGFKLFEAEGREHCISFCNNHNYIITHIDD